MNNNKGFSLIELLITVTIIALLLAIAVPTYIGQKRRAAFSEAQSNLEQIRLLAEQFFAENGVYAEAGVATCAAYPCTFDYKATAAADQGLEDVLRFRPGPLESLNFNYRLVVEGPDGLRYDATATGKVGTIVENNNFIINERNERNW